MAVALIVIEVFISASGIWSNSARMSPRCWIGTPTLPTSPRASGWSASYPVCVGRSKATDRPVWPLARLRRNSAFDSAAEECPAYVRITQGRSFFCSPINPRVGPCALVSPPLVTGVTSGLDHSRGLDRHRHHALHVQDAGQP